MDNQPTDDQKPQKWRWLLFATPAIVFVVMAMMLAKGLQYDPTKLPLAIKGQTFPEFRLPDLLADRLIDQTQLQGPALVNIWATWCPTCIVEHEALTQISQRGVPIYGVNYRDEPAMARSFLAKRGNPFRWVVEDYSGQLGMELGMFGAPETYFVDANNRVIHRHVGEVSVELWGSELAAVWEQAVNPPASMPSVKEGGQ